MEENAEHKQNTLSSEENKPTSPVKNKTRKRECTHFQKKP